MLANNDTIDITSYAKLVRGLLLMIIMMIFDSPVQRKTHTTLKVHDVNYIFSQKVFLSSLNTRYLPCKPFYLVKTARAESKF